jgi:hypothetical protein
MMARVPVDLAAITRDIKNRCARASGNIEAIAQNQEPIFQDPRQVMLELVLARHEIEAAIFHHEAGVVAVKDQSTPSYRAVPSWLVNLPKVDAPSITPAETNRPLSPEQVERYWRMRRAYWWMSDAEVLRRLRDPEID